ncbi:hypothetical protein, partial [Ruthenibacterium lactatiformans]|uniref:hypothetical protein n=1 Tax=Ruthenibacterium lactatiformans TaxID=1550024 RepID=UPI0022E2D1BA
QKRRYFLISRGLFFVQWTLVIEYIKKYIFVNNKYVENSDVSLYNVNEHKEITLWSNHPKHPKNAVALWQG